jgi:hypothetical protein
VNLCTCGKPTLVTLCPECTTQVVTHLRALATGGVYRIRVHQRRVITPAVLDDAGEIVTPSTAKVVQDLRTDTRPSLYELLVDTLVRRDHTGSDSIGAVSGVASYEVDFHAKASELKRTIDDLLREWAADVAKRNGRTLTATSVRGAAAWLASQPKLLAAHPDAGELADQLHKINRSVLRVIDRDPERVYLGQCSARVQLADGEFGECEADIYAPRDRPVVQCRACGAIWEVEPRRNRLLSAVDEQLATPPEISRALSKLGLRVTVNMIHGYVHRGRLDRYPPHPLDPNQRARYKVGDVRAILNEINLEAS